MKSNALVMTEYQGPLTVQSFDVPEPGAGAAVVKIKAATICGTDNHIYMGGFHPASKTPSILGHEMVGEIAALGEGRTLDVIGKPLSAGDRVIWAYAFCGQCYYCAVAQQPTLCMNATQYGGRWDCSTFPYLLGGFSEYCYVLPQCHIVKVPEEIPSHWASSASCALRTIMHAVHRAGGIRPHETVLIQGSGPVGLYGVAAARALGARHVVCFGAPEDRLAVAGDWGAETTCNVTTSTPQDRKALMLDLTDGRGADLIFECSGSNFAVEEGLDLVRPGGRYGIVGAGDPNPASIKGMTFVNKQINLFGVRSAGIGFFLDAIQFLIRHRKDFDFERLFGNTYDLTQIPEAMKRMRELREIKPIVNPAQ